MTDKPKIIVSDDDVQIQKLVRCILEKHGFDVLVCNDGIKAKEVIEHNPVDLIISDYMMPNDEIREKWIRF